VRFKVLSFVDVDAGGVSYGREAVQTLRMSLSPIVVDPDGKLSLDQTISGDVQDITKR
jgi:hypothetical protein